MYFKLVGSLTEIQTFAAGRGIRELKRLQRVYGRANWRKRKGVGLVEMASGDVRRAELHWYEATGLGRFELKIKRFVD